MTFSMGAGCTGGAAAPMDAGKCEGGKCDGTMKKPEGGKCEGGKCTGSAPAACSGEKSA